MVVYVCQVILRAKLIKNLISKALIQENTHYSVYLRHIHSSKIVYLRIIIMCHVNVKQPCWFAIITF